jgi:hypothetical protein
VDASRCLHAERHPVREDIGGGVIRPKHGGRDVRAVRMLYRAFRLWAVELPVASTQVSLLNLGSTSRLGWIHAGASAPSGLATIAAHFGLAASSRCEASVSPDVEATLGLLKLLACGRREDHALHGGDVHVEHDPQDADALARCRFGRTAGASASSSDSWRRRTSRMRAPFSLLTTTAVVRSTSTCLGARNVVRKSLSGHDIANRRRTDDCCAADSVQRGSSRGQQSLHC